MLKISRGFLLNGSAAAFALALSIGPAAAQQSLTVVSFGGSYQDAMRKAAYEPISKLLGISFKEDSLKGYADIKLQVQSGKPTWDVTEGGSQFCTRGDIEGTFEPLDVSIVANVKDLDSKVVYKSGVGVLYFSMVIAWSVEKYGSNPPKDWRDFFDIAKFPGRRALYNQPRFIVEAALLGDGVARDKLYPLDIDRAIKKLASVRKDIPVFYASHGQAVQLVKDREVDMIAILNGRIESAIKDGAKYAYTFNDGIMDTGCLAVPKGAPNKALAMRFINEYISADIQANVPNFFPYGPVNPKAFQTGKIKADLLKILPSSPDNFKVQTILDTAWWTANESKIEPKWDAFLQRR